MSLLYTGNAAFEDLYLPVKGKSEWGMDTLTRKLRGERALLPAFIAGLAQGQAYGDDYFLQSWEPDDDPVFATITLLYKGLQDGTLPPVDVQREYVTVKGTTTQDYSTENSGKGRPYRKQVLWKYWFEAVASGSGIVSDEVVGTRDVYAISAQMEFTYIAVEARYRYITDEEPVAASHDTVETSYTLIVDEARIITSTGEIFGREMESFFDLAPEARQRVVSFMARNVIGTPFYECEDVVRLELGNPEA